MLVTQFVLALGVLLVLVAVSTQIYGRGQAARSASVAVGTIGGLTAGVPVGLILMALYGDRIDPYGEASVRSAPAPAKKKGMGGLFRGMGVPGGAGPGESAEGPNPKRQLVTLVRKLGQVVNRPIAVTLDEDRKAQLLEQLEGLERLRVLTREDAKQRLEAILKLLEDQRDELELVGYRWPGPPVGGGGPGGMSGMGAMMEPADPDNPFQERSGSIGLSTLRTALERAD